MIVFFINYPIRKLENINSVPTGMPDQPLNRPMAKAASIIANSKITVNMADDAHVPALLRHGECPNAPLPSQ